MVDMVAPKHGGAALPIDGSTPVATPSARPIREVLSSPDFRRYWTAQTLAALGSGALRFVFVWLALDLSNWPAAPGLVSLALGLPALVLLIPAGVWSDQFDRRRLIVSTQIGATVTLGAAAIVSWADLMSVAVAVPFAIAAGGLLAVSSPALQALVPSLVPPHRIMTGAALQGMGQNVGLLFGAMVGGGTIAVFGSGGAFAILGALQAIAAIAMARVRLPQRAQPTRGGMRGDIGAGLRFALGHEPIRSLLAVGLLVGFAWGVVTILLPEVAKDELHVGAFQTSLLFSVLGAGMFATSMLLASRHNIRRPGLLIAIVTMTLMGGALVFLGLSRIYILTFIVMLVWGIGGGVSMTLQRGLLQRHTPDELMGRVMGFSSLAMVGSFPLSAVTASVLSSALGAAGALTAVGGGLMMIAALIGSRRALRSA